MDTEETFVVDDAEQAADEGIHTAWSEAGPAVKATDTAPHSRENTRVNLAARRAIEEYQERKRLRQLVGDEFYDL